MPTIVMSKQSRKLDASLKQKAYTFLEKLADDDTVLGLHIEPIHNSADSRVRTGRVDDGYRAVLFKMSGGVATTYLFYGIWPHDDAIAVAKKTVLEVNPVTGVSEIHTVPATPGPSTPVPAPTQLPEEGKERRKPRRAGVVPSLLGGFGLTADRLRDELGIDTELAARALAATGEAELLTAVGDGVEWQAMALLDLGTGLSLEDVCAKLELTRIGTPEAPVPTTDESILEGLRQPAAKQSFIYIEDDAELRKVLEGDDFGQWRVFLHPEQRRYATRSTSGPFRLTGGAGTGKTVVVVHRAAMLARRSPQARILVTTFTKNLAHALDEQLRLLDDTLPRAKKLGEPGIYVAGIDSLAASVVHGADGLGEDLASVLGPGSGEAARRMVPAPWEQSLEQAGAALPENLRSTAFLAAEYGSIVLPSRITTREAYYRVRRPGRGVALDRAKRAAVWDLVQTMRAESRTEGTWDYPEAAAVAAAHLERTRRTVAEHVLVDEGQDLSPAHWQLLRAAVADHADDLFIAEDSHQRIYARRIVLAQYGIKVTGRSKRLTLNYRTTAENLAYALGVLSGGAYVDLEEGAEQASGYRSARSGVAPQLMPCNSLVDELDQAARLLKQWTGQERAAETIGVLVRDRYQRDRVEKGLAERGVKVRAVATENVLAGQPVVMTMHRAKGMEFAKVLLFGINDKSIPAAMRDERYTDDAWLDALLRERSLLYVAASRARDELVVSWSGQQSELLAKPS